MFMENEVTDPDPTDSTFELPERTASAAALDFCEFTPAAANEVYLRFVRRPDQDNSPVTYSQKLLLFPCSN